MRVYLAKDLLQANKSNAQENRNLLAESGTLMVNVMGSPGCGKTTFLQQTLQAFSCYRVSVIVGDLYTLEDTEKLAPWCERAVQINTEGACHLEAGQIGHLMVEENLVQSDIVFVENIGNLVCPAEFDLGEDFRIALISVTEGNDKPRKYPLVFKSASAVMITKVDLLPHCNFSVARAEEDLYHINPDLKIFTISAENGVGMKEWVQWLSERIKSKIEPA